MAVIYHPGLAGAVAATPYVNVPWPYPTDSDEQAAGLAASRLEIPSARVGGWLNVERFGADGAANVAAAGKNRSIFQKAADFAVANGLGLFVPPGRNFYFDECWRLKSNLSVWSVGATLTIARNSTSGGFINFEGASNVWWLGGTIDGGGALGPIDGGLEITNINGLSIGDGAAAYPDITNVLVHGVRIVNCRRGPGNNNPGWTHHSGGGKGITMQFRVYGAVLSNIVVEDCDFPLTIEAAYSNSRRVRGNQLTNISCRNCESGVLLGGTRPPTTGSLDDFGFEESDYGQTTIRNLTLENCGTDDDSGEYGVFTSNYAVGMDIEATVRCNAARVTLWRGNVAHSKIKINAFVDDLHDAIDLRSFTDATNAGSTSAGYEFDITAHVADSIDGVLVRGDGALTSRGEFDVSYYHDTPPTLAANLPANTAIRYEFWDMRTGKRVDGSTASNATPAMPGSTTTVLHNDADTAINGIVRIAPNSTGAGAYLAPMWLNGQAIWVDSAGKLRIKSSSPSSDTDGTVVGAQT